MSEQKLTFPDRPIGDVQSLGVDAMKSGGVTLVARTDCEAVVVQVVNGNYEFRGFEAFTVFPDDSIQPHLRWSCDWPESVAPTVPGIMKLIREAPDEVTHFEFYFRPNG